jgi:Tfp pilus assembly protein PilN
MRNALGALVVAAALVAAGCGGGANTEELESQITQLRTQVAAQQREIDQLKENTSSLRALEQRVDDLLEKIPDLDQLTGILDQLGIG